MSLLTRHPVRGKVMVNDLILQVDSGHVLWMRHGYSQQDAHQQVDHLRTGRSKAVRVWIYRSQTITFLSSSQRMFENL